MKSGVLIALLCCGGVAAAQEVSVPSGLSMTLQEVLMEQSPSNLARFRFVAPAIKDGGIAFADVVEDIEFLCRDVVLPALAANDWTGDSVVISLSEVALPFGEPAPEVTQYFQPYTIKDGACIWDQF